MEIKMMKLLLKYGKQSKQGEDSFVQRKYRSSLLFHISFKLFKGIFLKWQIILGQQHSKAISNKEKKRYKVLELFERSSLFDLFKKKLNQKTSFLVQFIKNKCIQVLLKKIISRQHKGRFRKKLIVKKKMKIMFLKINKQLLPSKNSKYLVIKCQSIISDQDSQLLSNIQLNI